MCVFSLAPVELARASGKLEEVGDFFAGVTGPGHLASLASVYEAAYGQIHPGGVASANDHNGISGGSRAEALRDVTNNPADSTRSGGTTGGYDTHERSEIQTALDEGRPVTAGTGGSPDANFPYNGNARVTVGLADGSFAEITVPQGHAYSVERSDAEGVWIRNPWGAYQSRRRRHHRWTRPHVMGGFLLPILQRHHRHHLKGDIVTDNGYRVDIRENAILRVTEDVNGPAYTVSGLRVEGGRMLAGISGGDRAGGIDTCLEVGGTVTHPGVGTFTLLDIDLSTRVLLVPGAGATAQLFFEPAPDLPLAQAIINSQPR